MKKISVIVLLLLALVLCMSADKKSPDTKICGDQGLLLTISLPKGLYKVKAEIPLTFTITNTNEKDMNIPIGFTYAHDFDKDAKTCAIGSGTFIICQKQNGDYLKFKGVYTKVDGIGQTLKTGEELKTYTINLAKCFDLTPGKYDVQLLFTKRYSGFIDAASNRITFSVI
jgi:hypothetical protein